MDRLEAGGAGGVIKFWPALLIGLGVAVVAGGCALVLRQAQDEDDFKRRNRNLTLSLSKGEVSVPQTLVTRTAIHGRPGNVTVGRSGSRR